MPARTGLAPMFPGFPASRPPRLRLLSALTAILLCLPVGGCNIAEKMQLQSRIDDLNGQKQGLITAIADQQAKVEGLNQQWKTQNAELDEYRTEIRSYMMDHAMAVAAIVAGVGGAGVALDSSNEFSDDAKSVGGVVAVVAAIWALGNMSEINQVLQTLNNADAHVRTLQARLDQTKSAIGQQQLLVQGTQTRLDQLTQQISGLKSQIDAL